jgi:UTP--glucose-1-phosphate uridylyltransferase
LRIKKAVITAAGERQRLLPLQTLIDRDGEEKSVLGILIEQCLLANVDDVCVVVFPGDEARYAEAAGKHAGHVRFTPQVHPRGYGHAVYSAREFVGRDPFLHLVGDHLYAGSSATCCAQRLVEAARAESCSVSAVQVTRESLLPNFGAVSGRRLPGRQGLYRIDTVIEKPTPTEAERRLTATGLRAGHYLCFFGMHVLTPTVMDLLEEQLDQPDARPPLSAALAELARREQYLALEEYDRRYDIGQRYGLLTAQLALALNGCDRSEVLARLVELLASREQAAEVAGPSTPGAGR